MKNDYSQLNIPLARKVLEFAEAEHDDFTHNQASWLWQVGECGTYGCLAGITCMLSPEVEITWSKGNKLELRGGQIVDSASIGGTNMGFGRTAMKLLGLTERMKSDLFYRVSTQNPEKNAIALLKAYIKRAEEAQHE